MVKAEYRAINSCSFLNKKNYSEERRRVYTGTRSINNNTGLLGKATSYNPCNYNPGVLGPKDPLWVQPITGAWLDWDAREKEI